MSGPTMPQGPQGGPPGGLPDGTGYQGPIPPGTSGGPPKTLKVLISIAVVALVGVIGFALFGRGGEAEAPSPSAAPATTSPPTDPTPSATPEPAPPGTTQTLTGTMELPPVSSAEPCPKRLPLTIEALGDDGESLDSSKLTLKPRGDACVGAFTMQIVPGPDITFALRFGPAEAEGQITGPTFTAEQLEERDYEVRLDLTSFGPQTPEGDGDRTLAPVLSAAMDYYQDHDGSFAGLDAATMGDLVPELTFNDADEVVTGEVSVREVKKDTILFVIELEDGTPYCRGIDPPDEGSYGFADLQTYQECLEWQGEFPGDTPQVL